jgi:hypothetical protein
MNRSNSIRKMDRIKRTVSITSDCIKSAQGMEIERSVLQGEHYFRLKERCIEFFLEEMMKYFHF